MMIVDLSHVKSVHEFNSDIRDRLEKRHGEGYTNIHDAITKYMEDCESYMELGVNQGGTASAVMLTNPKFIQLVDIDLRKYEKYLGPIASEYCAENNIELVTLRCDSRDKEAEAKVDMLMIDSVHQPAFMSKELNRHGKNVNKYIIAHDTFTFPALHKLLVKWGKENGFEMIEYDKNSAGYTVIKRIN